MRKIVFYFPWKVKSPNTVYLCQLANQLADDPGFEVYYTDYVNGVSDHFLKNYRVRRCPFTGNGQDMEFFPEEPIVLITPIDWAHTLPKLHPDSKVLFVNWSQESLLALSANANLSEESLEGLWELIHRNNAVVFVDRTHQLAQNQLTQRQHPDAFVPYITEFREPIAPSQPVSEEAYNVAIFSSLDRDSVYSAIEVINSISSSIPETRPVNIHIVGSGEKENLLFCRSYPNHINLIHYDPMTDEQAIGYLAENADIVFAQRTNALISGLIGLPTVILPEEKQYFRCNKYLFLHQVPGYALRWTPAEIDMLEMECCSAAEIFQQVYTDQQKAALGEACHNYVRDNHLSNVGSLKNALEQCTLRAEALKAVVPSESDVTQKSAASKSATPKAVQLAKKIFGQRVRRYCLMGIPFFTLRKAYEDQFNLYMLGCIPLLRIQIREKTFSSQILLLVWIGTFFKKLFNKLFGSKQKMLEEERLEVLRKRRIEEKLARNEKIRVCLFEPRISCWQFGRIYQLLENSDVFEPIVVVTPFVFSGKDAMIEYMDTTYEELQKQGYRVVKAYDKETDTYMNIKKELNPDAVFYSMFWKRHFHDNWYISKFRDVYSFLYPYGFDVYYHPDCQGMNFELQNQVSRYYQPTKIHVAMAQDNMTNRGINAYATGSPKLDCIIDPDYSPEDPWKDRSGKKRIIWAPHHSLKMGADYAQLCAFFDLSDYMLELAEKYRDSVCFAFKPHPMLKPKLYELWGSRKTDAYFDAWANGVNTQLEDGAFVDLFLTSDAMILDSISFVAEYTYTNKPAFFTYAKETRFPTNQFGTAILKVLYRNKNANTLNADIERFITSVVMDGNDPYAQKRSAFIQKFMLPENGRLAAENIYEDMRRVILENRLEEYIIDWSDTYGENP